MLAFKTDPPNFVIKGEKFKRERKDIQVLRISLIFNVKYLLHNYKILVFTLNSPAT